MRKKITRLRLKQWLNEFNPCGQWYRIRTVTLNSAKSVCFAYTASWLPQFYKLCVNVLAAESGVLITALTFFHNNLLCDKNHFIIDIYLIAIVNCIERIKIQLNLTFRKCVNNKQEAKCFSFALCVGVFSFQCTSVSICVSNSVCIELPEVYFKLITFFW